MQIQKYKHANTQIQLSSKFIIIIISIPIKRCSHVYALGVVETSLLLLLTTGGLPRHVEVLPSAIIINISIILTDTAGSLTAEKIEAPPPSADDEEEKEGL